MICNTVHLLIVRYAIIFTLSKICCMFTDKQVIKEPYK